MMKWRKILLLMLLAVGLLAAFAACGQDKDAKQAENIDLKFIHGERICQADVDFFREAMIGLTDANFPDNELVQQMAMLRAIVLEAESQNLAISWEDARAYAETQYQEWQTLAADKNNPESAFAKSMLDYAQELMQTMSITEDDYLDYLAYNQQASEALRTLREQFIAGLPVDEQGDVLGYSDIVYKYTSGLIEKYRTDLVEDDLLLTLDEVIEDIKNYYAE